MKPYRTPNSLPKSIIINNLPRSNKLPTEAVEKLRMCDKYNKKSTNDQTNCLSYDLNLIKISGSKEIFNNTSNFFRKTDNQSQLQYYQKQKSNQKQKQQKKNYNERPSTRKQLRNQTPSEMNRPTTSKTCRIRPQRQLNQEDTFFNEDINEILKCTSQKKRIVPKIKPQFQSIDPQFLCLFAE